jgi:hypothetical protein
MKLALHPTASKIRLLLLLVCDDDRLLLFMGHLAYAVEDSLDRRIATTKGL